jgi:transcriptional regulator with XRE-family HTH domain
MLIKNSENSQGRNNYFDLQRDLIALIDDFRAENHINNKKMSLKEFSEHSQISIEIITAITNGHRSVANSNRETIEKLASVLEIPVLQVFILSGLIKNEDVVYTGNIEETLDFVYKQMSDDVNMATKLPQKTVWDSWPQSAKISFVMMYEAITNKIVLNYTKLN